MPVAPIPRTPVPCCAEPKTPVAFVPAFALPRTPVPLVAAEPCRAMPAAVEFVTVVGAVPVLLVPTFTALPLAAETLAADATDWTAAVPRAAAAAVRRERLVRGSPSIGSVDRVIVVVPLPASWRRWARFDWA